MACQVSNMKNWIEVHREASSMLAMDNETKHNRVITAIDSPAAAHWSRGRLCFICNRATTESFHFLISQNTTEAFKQIYLCSVLNLNERGAD